mmetsp:Transcript_8144/g.16211  ORF Transcript_8144/g.16211 Transcript_8144/m.16211 type:complete len:242 (-) Transcript_8144:594-1319(-)
MTTEIVLPCISENTRWLVACHSTPWNGSSGLLVWRRIASLNSTLPVSGMCLSSHTIAKPSEETVATSESWFGQNFISAMGSAWPRRRPVWTDSVWITRTMPALLAYVMNLPLLATRAPMLTCEGSALTSVMVVALRALAAEVLATYEDALAKTCRAVPEWLREGIVGAASTADEDTSLSTRFTDIGGGVVAVEELATLPVRIRCWLLVLFAWFEAPLESTFETPFGSLERGAAGGLGPPAS